MASKIIKNGKVRWKGRVQKLGLIRQKLFNSRAEALGWEAEERKENWDALRATCTIREWSELYLTHGENFSRKTRNEKQQAFRELFRARVGSGHDTRPVIAPDAPVNLLTPGKVLQALQRQFITRGGNAANKDRKNLVAAWNWGMKYLNLPSPNPCAVEKFPEKRQPRYVPDENDFWKIFAVAEGQDRVMLLTFLHLGARRAEVFRLQWEDVDFHNARIRLCTRKRQSGSLEYDWLPMTEALSTALTAWKAARTFADHPSVFVCDPAHGGHCPPQHYGQPFTERAQFMKRLCTQAGVRPFGFHAIRHLTASILYKMGQPVSVIQVVLRHRSPHTTTLYLRSLGLEETRDALEAMSRLCGGNAVMAAPKPAHHLGATPVGVSVVVDGELTAKSTTDCVVM